MHDSLDLLTPDDVARRLAMSRKRVYRLIESGGLPHFKIGRSIRISSTDLAQWIERHRRRSGSAPGEPGVRVMGLERAGE